MRIHDSAAATDREAPVHDAAPRGPFGTPLSGAPRRRPAVRWLFALLPLALIAGLLVALWYTPYRTFDRLRDAARRHDGAELSRLVDDDAVRAQLRAQLAQRAVAQRSGSLRDSLLSGAAAGVASAFVGTAVDRLASPAGLAALLDGRADDVPPAGGAATPATPAGASPPVAPPRYDSSHDDFNRFSVIVRRAEAPDRPVMFVLTRHHGLWWRLTGIRLPDPPPAAP